MADIIQIAESLNSDVTRLNNERSKMEGMLESAKTNYEKAVKAYEMKYGVKLTEETLQAEYNEVFARTKGAILDLQEKIDGIKRGEYKKDIEDVQYDLEPDVEPIRAEKPEPEKKKRGRKPKAEAKVEEVAPVVEVNIEEQAEDIDDVTVAPVVTVEPTPVVAPVIEAPVMETPIDNSDIEDAPFKLDFDFGGFGENTTITAPAEPTPVSKPKSVEKIKGGQGRKPLSPTDISAAVAAADSVKQNPVTLPNISDDDDDEVDLGSLNFGAKPVEPTSDFGFGSFGDLGGFGGFEEPKSEPKKEAPKKAEPVESFGGFGDFGGFGGFGDLKESNNDEADEDDIEDVIPGDGFSFGGLGDFGMTSEPKKEAPKKKEEPITPEGWGADLKFGDFGDFGSILNSGDFKFGE